MGQECSGTGTVDSHMGPVLLPPVWSGHRRVWGRGFLPRWPRTLEQLPARTGGTQPSSL